MINSKSVMDDLVQIGGSKFKMVFLGDQGVGKSALASRLVHGIFENSYHSTVGIDFATKTIQIDDEPVILQVWDTAGQERFRSLIPSYIRDSHALFVVFDVTNTGSFETLEEWVSMARGRHGTYCQIEPLVVILGNKVDQFEERKVSFDDASVKMSKLGLTYCETSALTGLNVDELFRKITADLYLKERERRKASGELGLRQEKKKATDLTNEPKQKQNTCAC